MRSRKPTVLLVGGGSGGHITPLAAIAENLHSKTGDTVRVVYVGQRGESLQDVLDIEAIDDVWAIFAGKFRRYNAISFWRQILKLRTLAYNCLLYTSPSPRDRTRSRMPSSA